jgi:hypothetical protein
MPPVKKEHSPLRHIQNLSEENNVKNGPKRSNLRCAEKVIIQNVRNYFYCVKSGEIEINSQQVVKNTALCCGVSECTVKNVSREVKNSENNEPSSPKKKIGRPRIVLDEYFQGVVRRKVHQFYLRKIYPTIANILAELRNENEDFPDISEQTMYSLMKCMGFRFRKYNNKSVCFESPRIADQRHKFLRTIKRLRQRGIKIYYTDDTWCGANHTLKYGWQEKVEEGHNVGVDFDRSKIQEVNGWKGGLITPSGAGKHLIILAVDDEDGFLEPQDDKTLVFEGKKGSADYHNEMNAQPFEEWFCRVLQHVPDKSGIVIDRAPYHTMQDPESKNPTLYWKKEDIIQWLIERKIEPSIDDDGFQDCYEDMTKKELIDMGKDQFKPFEYRLERIIRESNRDVKIIWTPVAHCEFNAIELIWAWVKREIAKENKTFKIKDVEKMCIEKLRSIPGDLWRKAVQHVKKIEEEYWVKDRLVDVEVC